MEKKDATPGKVRKARKTEKIEKGMMGGKKNGDSLQRTTTTWQNSRKRTDKKEEKKTDKKMANRKNQSE